MVRQSVRNRHERAAGGKRAFFQFSALELLVTLLLYVVIIPFLGVLPHSELIQAVLLTFVLLFAILVVADNSRALLMAAIIAIPAFAGKWANYFRPDVVPAEAFLAASLIFVAFVVLHLFRFIMRTPHVDVQVLSAAAANYLMMGVGWMFVYALIAELFPGSFAVGGSPSDLPLDSFDALYFSLVTLCTVGYGDITPVLRPARMMAVLEAMAGILYVTIVIARLVALYSSEGQKENKPEHSF